MVSASIFFIIDKRLTHRVNSGLSQLSQLSMVPLSATGKDFGHIGQCCNCFVLLSATAVVCVTVRDAYYSFCGEDDGMEGSGVRQRGHVQDDSQIYLILLTLLLLTLLVLQNLSYKKTDNLEHNNYMCWSAKSVLTRLTDMKIFTYFG